MNLNHPPARIAVYWAPELTDPLHEAGSTWLGRDAWSGTEIFPATPLTTDARNYGFHATLRPPMRLRAPQTDFVTAVRAAAAKLQPFRLPNLKITSLNGYLALTLATPSPAFQTLADACVISTDPFRLPPSDSELARRRRHGLTPTQEALLKRWGYPYVLQEWRFHMTLSKRLTPSEMAEALPAAQSHFAKTLESPREVKTVSLFVQAEAGADGLLAPFRAVERVALGA